ncbi:MAG TPA: hypothetical protein VGS57_10345 [Thermoanaerobaculia bacterium]|nr:hypothetical protein [Thermoanaerobaculia bacterium]
MAFDAKEARVGEARQWLNLPREAAELEVAVTRDGGPPPRLVARLAWAGPGGATPTAVSATLDGAPVALSADSTSLSLPAVAGAAKLLRVEADFAGGVRAVREMAVGGELAEEITQELTGVPVEVVGREAPKSLREDERELPLVALEKGEADLVAVLDPAALHAIGERAAEGRQQRVVRGGIGLGPSASPGARSIAAESRLRVPLPEGAWLRLVWPVAESHQQGQLRYDLFPTSPERTAVDGSLLEQLGRAAMLPPGSVAPRIADAVALAALTAAQPGRRRAVLLVLGASSADASAYDAARVRRFLDRLRVPLVVWSTAPVSPAVAAAWGDVETVTSGPRLETAAKRLDALLARQRIAWVEGRHLPQRLLAGSDGRLRLATADQPLAAGGTSESATLDEPTKAGDAALHGESNSAAPPAELADESGPPHGELENAAAPGDLDAAARPAGGALPALPPGLPVSPLPPFSLATDVRDARLLATLGAVASALPADWSARFGLPVTPRGTLLLFAHEADFRAWLAAQGGGDQGVEGFARHGIAALAVEGRKSEEVSALMVHELSHLLARGATGRPLPPWLEEGLAEELAVSRRDGDGHSVPGTLRARADVRGTSGLPQTGRTTYERTISGPVAALLALVRGPRPPLAELLARPPAAFNAASGRPERYAAAAFFLRFLLDDDGGRLRQPFQGFLAAVAAGGPADAAALGTALAVPLPALQERFDGWLRRTALTLR